MEVNTLRTFCDTMVIMLTKFCEIISHNTTIANKIGLPLKIRCVTKNMGLNRNHQKYQFKWVRLKPIYIEPNYIDVLLNVIKIFD